MKNLNFYPSIWQLSPYSLELAAHIEAERRRSLDLTLKNTQAQLLNVAEMSLNINGFAVIDQQGNETHIDDFTEQERLQLKGQHSGLFIRTRHEVYLPTGEYRSIRFYLKPWDNRFIISDFSSKEIFETEYLDFEIEGGLNITKDQSYALKLRFDFKPYTFKGLIRLIKHKILGKMKPEMAHSFAD